MADRTKRKVDPTAGQRNGEKAETELTKKNIEGSEEAQAPENASAPVKSRLTPEQRRKKRRKKRRRLAILWIVFLLAAAALIYVVVALIFTAWERKAARDQYVEMQSLYETSDSVDTADKDGADGEPQPTLDSSLWYADKGKPADKGIDFAALQARNADVCGWITVEGTDIDYPVLRAEGPDVLYLSHDIDGKPSEHGAICLDVLCSRDFSDRVTLIYGHNMKDGSMFAPLYNYYRDAGFFNADHKVKIYLDDAVLTYKVFSACEFNYAHPLFFYDMADDEDFLAYVDSFLSNRDLKARILPATITPEDHVITLITSTNVRADQRLFIQAVLVDG